MLIQNTTVLAPTRFDRRVTSYCDIWDLVAPEVACPACSGAHDEHLATVAHEEASAGDAMPRAAVEEHLVLLEDVAAGDADEDAVEDVEAAPSYDREVSAQASALLSLLAS